MIKPPQIGLQILISELSEIAFNLWFFFLTIWDFFSCRVMDMHAKWVYWCVLNNLHIISILMFVGQFDPHIFMIHGNCPELKWNHFLVLCWFLPIGFTLWRQTGVFPHYFQYWKRLSQTQMVKMSYHFYFQSIWNNI